MAIASRNTYTYLQKLEDECRFKYNEARGRGDYRRADEIYDYFQKRKAEIEMNEDTYTNMFGTSMGQLGIADNNSSAITSLNNSTNNLIAQQYQNALMNQQLYGSNMGNQPSIANGTYTAQSEKDFKPEFGTLYMHNKELPADWCGAKITEYKRNISVTGNRWTVVFGSKWDKALEIRIYLDIEELNGKEVNAMAETYMEALNQRRAG